MNEAETIRRTAVAIAPGSAYTAQQIEALIGALCAVSRAEGILEGANQAGAALAAQMAIIKVAA